MLLLRVIVFELFLVSAICGQLKLSDVQSGVFDSATYTVDKDLIVPEGRTLELLPGSRMKFMPYTGIKVFGNLKLSEIELTSLDGLEEEWNGVEVAFKGRIDFENVIIDKSIKGISVPDSSSIIKFSNVLFKGNRRGLQIANIPVLIREGCPVTIVLENDNKNIDRKVVLGSDKQVVVKSTPWTNFAMRWGTAISSLACIGATIYYADKSDTYATLYNESNNLTETNRMKNSSIRYRRMAIGTGIVAGLSGLGLILSLKI